MAEAPAWQGRVPLRRAGGVVLVHRWGALHKDLRLGEARLARIAAAAPRHPAPGCRRILTIRQKRASADGTVRTPGGCVTESP